MKNAAFGMTGAHPHGTVVDFVLLAVYMCADSAAIFRAWKSLPLACIKENEK